MRAALGFKVLPMCTSTRLRVRFVAAAGMRRACVLSSRTLVLAGAASMAVQSSASTRPCVLKPERYLHCPCVPDAAPHRTDFIPKWLTCAQSASQQGPLIKDMRWKPPKKSALMRQGHAWRMRRRGALTTLCHNPKARVSDRRRAAARLPGGKPRRVLRHSRTATSERLRIMQTCHESSAAVAARARRRETLALTTAACKSRERCRAMTAKHQGTGGAGRASCAASRPSQRAGAQQ